MTEFTEKKQNFYVTLVVISIFLVGITISKGSSAKLNRHQSYPFSHDEDGAKGYSFFDSVIYKIECLLGDADSCSNIGSVLLNKDKEGNAQKASEYYKASCSEGSALGCHNLGKMYYSGLYHKQDYNEAFSFFDESCKGGSYRGCSSLGVMFHHGNGVDKDREKAFIFYKKACTNNVFSGCNNIGTLSSSDKVVNYDLAIHNYDIACAHGVSIACNNSYLTSKKLEELEGGNDSNIVGEVLTLVFLRGLGRVGRFGRLGRAASVRVRAARIMSAKQIQKMDDIAYKRDRAWQNHLMGNSHLNY